MSTPVRMITTKLTFRPALPARTTKMANLALAPTVSPTTGLITGTPTIAQLYNGMVIPGSSFSSNASSHFPEASSGLYNGLFRGVPDHYSNIQWGDIQPRVGIAYQLNNKTVKIGRASCRERV